ncbi:hypothetical protein GCM10009430_32150 [Aquimarina litoralis]|uniref:Dual-action HEIGH metallo-peptidase n=1 Tax=Aquimarina litoralis TaxID=584605 RepID=A0ABP3U7D4_9FLAO
MKLIKIITLTLLTILMFSCEREDIDNNNSQTKIPHYVLEKLAKQGVNINVIEDHSYDDGEGNITEGYLAGDIFFSINDIKTIEDLPSIDDIEGQKLYRTRNLVRVPNQGRRNISVRGLKLPEKLKRTLRRAVNNYNKLDLKIKLNLSFGNTEGGKDIIVRVNSNIPAAADAGFPNRGNPFKRVRVNYALLRNVNDGTITTILMHELGHCFGLRHSDYKTRSSCGSIIDEDSLSGIQPGAIYIPGTDRSGNSQTSIMRACLSISDKGTFFQQDRRGLRQLYGR